MRLWIGARIPFTPVRVGTSVGGRGSGMGCLGLLGFLVAMQPVIALCNVADAHPVAAWLIIGGLVGAVALWWLNRRPMPVERAAQAKISDRR
jgi:membrane associated rhomboid family serine protease